MPSSPSHLVAATLIWVDNLGPNGIKTAYVHWNGKVFRVCYQPSIQTLGIAPCNMQEIEVGTTAFYGCALVMMVITAPLPTTISHFLRWAFDTYETLGILKAA